MPNCPFNLILHSRWKSNIFKNYFNLPCFDTCNICTPPPKKKLHQMKQKSFGIKNVLNIFFFYMYRINCYTSMYNCYSLYNSYNVFLKILTTIYFLKINYFILESWNATILTLFCVMFLFQKMLSSGRVLIGVSNVPYWVFTAAWLWVRENGWKTLSLLWISLFVN